MVDEGGRIGELLVTDHLPVRVGQFDPDHRLARNGRDARGNCRHVAGDIFCKTDHAAGLDTRCRLQFVHGDHGSGAHRGDLTLHVEIVEHVFQQARIAFQRHLVELWRSIFGRIIEQIVARQFVIGEHVALLGLGGNGLSRHRRGIGDFGRAARFAQWQILVILKAFHRLGTGLLLGCQRQVEFGQVCLAFDEIRQGQELRPVDREDPGDERHPAAERDKSEQQHDPA